MREDTRTLRIHRFLPCNTVNGPGKRFVLWLQGCIGVPQPNGATRNCPGCWNSHTWDPGKGTSSTLDSIVEMINGSLLKNSIQGVTFSGGEPFQQARALSFLARKIRESLNLSLLIFTGYTYEFLMSSKAPSGSADLLKWTDALVAGPYLLSQKSNRSNLLGSANQEIVILSNGISREELLGTQQYSAALDLSGHVTHTGFPEFLTNEQVWKKVSELLKK
ncbi:MAG: anaerobic ribonucleoside-triphosphate reductase activating protein [Parcubacteria group bacterium Gr01-1014_18]|nr:MAG: anaerobic ribonucleoside-triphosphate reductase activating protein [Parcubacteria group bacterium Greene0416_36]TSC80722.1 MAG: anaerobic ribonucleoside-triphosphate reductase activating protein [Parcubacteria group bacterium Gr01-1014_18]TSC98667.1 MAG: anaerobic ribonucleoside-triphosphate reductase activating protein [Parcubacteria group bacterium Greene1014_20]TSD07173.1 MAG: anaerobic ribonucleoside-triphosphate reductase activating protein [Parcubacteria group bacterium Greene0714_